MTTHYPVLLFGDKKKTFRPHGDRILAGMSGHKAHNTDMSWSQSVTDNRHVVCGLLYISKVFMVGTSSNLFHFYDLSRSCPCFVSLSQGTLRVTWSLYYEIITSERS